MFRRIAIASVVFAAVGFAGLTAKAAYPEDLKYSSWETRYGTGFTTAFLHFQNDTGRYDDEHGGGTLQNIQYAYDSYTDRVFIDGEFADGRGTSGWFKLTVAANGLEFQGVWGEIEFGKRGPTQGTWKSYQRLSDAQPTQWKKPLPLHALKWLPAEFRNKRVAYIDDAATWARVWTAWFPAKPRPAVDFERQIVVFIKNVRYFNAISVREVIQEYDTLVVKYGTTRTARPIRDEVHCVMFAANRGGLRSIVDYEGERVRVARR